MRLAFPVYENKEVDIVVKVEGLLQQTKHKERKICNLCVAGLSQNKCTK